MCDSCLRMALGPMDDHLLSKEIGGNLVMGCDPDASFRDGDTLLCIAVRRKSLELVRLLVDFGADVSKRGCGGVPPLVRASASKSAEICRILIEAGASVNDADNLGITPLIMSSMVGDREVSEFLINSGANAEARDSSGWTAFIYSIASCDFGLQRLLLDCAPYSVESDDDYFLARHRALQFGCDDACALIDVQKLKFSMGSGL